MITKYHPVTKEELDQIKNDCAYPEREFCDDCELAGAYSEGRSSGLECKFKGANILMDEVVARTDPLEVLEKWVQQYYEYHSDWSIDILKAPMANIIKRLRENPQSVVEEGIKNGWLK